MCCLGKQVYSVQNYDKELFRMIKRHTLYRDEWWSAFYQRCSGTGIQHTAFFLLLIVCAEFSVLVMRDLNICLHSLMWSMERYAVRQDIKVSCVLRSVENLCFVSPCTYWEKTQYYNNSKENKCWKSERSTQENGGIRVNTGILYKIHLWMYLSDRADKMSTGIRSNTRA